MFTGCVTVDRWVASNTEGPGLESSHRQHSLNMYSMLTVKDEKFKKKLPEMDRFKK